MKVHIKRINNTTPLPLYQTKGSVAFDIAAATNITIPPQSLGFIPTGLIIETPPGYMLMLASRSSTPKKKGLLIPHGIGIVDQDYCGEEDELSIQVFNFTKENVEVKAGERIAQGLFVRVEKAEWQEVQTMNKKSRGGFGSTGLI